MGLGTEATPRAIRGEHRARSAGFTLLEATIAAAVVLTVVVAATTALVGVTSGVARGTRTDAADGRLAAELERLRALPFGPGADATSGDDLLSAVFPHADPARATPTAFFAAVARDGCPPGTFFTLASSGDGLLTVAATFVVATATGFRPLATERLDGYDAADPACIPPSSAVLLTLSLVRGLGRDRRMLKRSVVVTAGPEGACRIASPSGLTLVSAQ